MLLLCHIQCWEGYFGNAPGSGHFTFTKLVYVWLRTSFYSCFLNERQFKASLVKKLKLKDVSATIVHDPAAPPEEASLPLNIFL